MAAPSAKKYANRNGYAHAEPAAPRNKFQIPNDRIHEKAGYFRFELPNDVIMAPFQKELPILFMLDVSPSMWINDRIRQQNEVVKGFLLELCKNDRVRQVARVAFCLFASKVHYQTDFMKLEELTFPEHALLAGIDTETISYLFDGETRSFTLNVPKFNAVREGGSDIPAATSHAVLTINKHREELRVNRNPYYFPVMVFMTDGNPDMTANYTEEERRYYTEHTKAAAAELNAVCSPECSYWDLIIPLFIGIGDADCKYLESISKHPKRNVLMVDNKPLRSILCTFRVIIEMISNYSASMRENSGTVLGRVEKLCEIAREIDFNK